MNEDECKVILNGPIKEEIPFSRTTVLLTAALDMYIYFK